MALLDQNGQPLRDPASAVLQRKYALAQALQKQGMDTSPVVGTGNNTMQAIARVLQAGAGAFLGQRAEGEAQAMSDAQKKERQDAQAQALALYSGAAPTTPAAPMTDRLGGAPPAEAPAPVPQVQQQPLGPTPPPGMYGRNAGAAAQRDAMLDAPPAVLASASAAMAQQRSGLPSAPVYREPEAGRSEGGAWAAGLPPATGAVPALAPAASASAAPAAPTSPAQDPNDMRRRAGLLRALGVPQGQSMAAALEQQAGQIESRRFRQEDTAESRRFQSENIAESRRLQQEARAAADERARIDDARANEQLALQREIAARAAAKDAEDRARAGIPTGYRPGPDGRAVKIEGIEPPASTTQPTEAERKAGSYLERMQGAEAMLQQLTRSSAEGGGGYTPGNIRDRASQYVPGFLGGNYLTTEPGQRYMNAAAEWARAKLRLESGAVIGEEEARAEARTYFPMPGDSPATITQKQTLRDTATTAIRRQAGRSGADIPLPEASAAPAAAAALPPLPSGFSVVR